MVVAIVVVVDVLVLVVAVGTGGCPPATVVMVDMIVLVDDGPASVVLLAPAVLDEAGTIVVDGLIASVDEVVVVSPTPSEFVVAVVGSVVDVVSAAADGADVVGPTVVDGRAGGPSGVTVVAGVVSAVAGVGVGASAAMAGAAAMKAVAAKEERERSNRLDIAAMIHAGQVPGRESAHFARNCSFLVKRTVAKRLYAHLRPKRPVRERRFGEFLGKPSRVEGL